MNARCDGKDVDNVADTAVLQLSMCPRLWGGNKWKLPLTGGPGGATPPGAQHGAKMVPAGIEPATACV